MNTKEIIFMANTKHVYIIGCKGIPAHYGGFETFVDNLVSRQTSNNIQYHVACISDSNKPTEKYHQAECFYINTPPHIRSARALVYDTLAIKYILKDILTHNYQDGVIYILACRIGPLLKKYIKKFHAVGFKVYVNPDGHEWKSKTAGVC